MTMIHADHDSEPYKHGYEDGKKMAPFVNKFPACVSIPMRWSADPGPKRPDGWPEAAHAYAEGVQDGWTDNYTPPPGDRLISDITTELDTRQ